MPTQSYWNNTASPHEFPPLTSNIKVDAAVIGGGNTGISAAYLLKQAGMSVALFERDRCGHADTGHTSAHLTYVSDLRLSQLVARFGRDHAQAVWDAGLASIEQIKSIVNSQRIDCEFAHVPGYLHAAICGDRDERTVKAKQPLELRRRKRRLSLLHDQATIDVCGREFSGAGEARRRPSHQAQWRTCGSFSRCGQ